MGRIDTAPKIDGAGAAACIESLIMIKKEDK
jgi:hypothetical protein